MRSLRNHVLYIADQLVRGNNAISVPGRSLVRFSIPSTHQKVGEGAMSAAILLRFEGELLRTACHQNTEFARIGAEHELNGCVDRVRLLDDTQMPGTTDICVDQHP